MTKNDIQLDGVIEMHAHAGPDLRERKMDAWELMDAAQSNNMGAVVLKNHYYPTMIEAQLLQKRYSRLRIFGGLALNYPSGGLNTDAVDKALQLNAKIIWFPTHDAVNERQFHNQKGGITILTEKATGVKAEVMKILQLIKQKNAILATGHLSFHEIILLLHAANEIGIEKKLVNHPGIIFQRFTIDQQREMVQLGAFLEHSYARPPHTLSWDDMANCILQVGPEYTVLATDLGQPQNVDPVTGMKEIWRELQNRGFTEDNLRKMTCENPAMLLEM